MQRLTSRRCNGIKEGYWSSARKEELIQRLAAYEDTGLEPNEILAGGKWISVNDRLPRIGEPVFICRPYTRDTVKVGQGCRDVGDWWKVFGTRTKHVTHWMALPEPPAPYEKY